MSSISYKDLKVWQRAMDLTVAVYQICRLLPSDENFGLIDQLKRAVVSIPSNIAEGQSRASVKEFLQFLSIASGSTAEVQTQLLICKRVGYLSQEQIQEPLDTSEEIGRMLTALKNSLQPKKQ